MATNGESFVVLTTQRSGSVWLMSTLNSLKDVTAHGELLLPRSRSRDLRWDSDFARPRYIESGLRSPRPFSLFSYLNGLYRTPGTVGFKLMYSQLRRYPETLAYLIARRIRVVHLVRENHLDVLISHAVCRQSRNLRACCSLGSAYPIWTSRMKTWCGSEGVSGTSRISSASIRCRPTSLRA
jgi:hypothetical protein